MAWSYSGNPASSDKDAVRFYTGDTDETDQLVTDEEINFTITNEGGAIMAAVAVCRAIAAKFSRQADKAIGDLRVSFSQKSEAYVKRAAGLELKGSGLAVPFAGGLTVADKETAENNTANVQPIFRRGVMTDGT